MEKSKYSYYICPKFHFKLTIISLESVRNAFSADVCEWFLVLDWIIHQRVPWEQNIRYIYLPSLHAIMAFPLVDILFITKEPLLIPKVSRNAYLSGKVPLWIYTVKQWEKENSSRKKRKKTKKNPNSTNVFATSLEP